MSATTGGRYKALVGGVESDYWVYDSEAGFDLTRPSPPASGPSANAINLRTTTTPIQIDAGKTALVIIDMQNFFLSTALGRPPDSKGLMAEKSLLDHALPAARKAGIQIVWVNWGLTEEDLRSLPPAVHKAFGVNAIPAADFDKRFSGNSDLRSASPIWQESTVNEFGKSSRMYVGVGGDLGEVTVDGDRVAAGRMLMRNQWNTKLTPELQKVYEGSLDSSKPDAWIHKLRMSGLHTLDTDTNRYLQEKGIRTLLFAGVNTDQCVGGTLMDAFAQGFDCIMLGDGCATSSPQSAQDCWTFNGAKTFGFLTDCEQFALDVRSSAQKVG